MRARWRYGERGQLQKAVATQEGSAQRIALMPLWQWTIMSCGRDIVAVAALHEANTAAQIPIEGRGMPCSAYSSTTSAHDQTVVSRAQRLTQCSGALRCGMHWMVSSPADVLNLSGYRAGLPND